MQAANRPLGGIRDNRVGGRDGLHGLPGRQAIRDVFNGARQQPPENLQALHLAKFGRYEKFYLPDSAEKFIPDWLHKSSFFSTGTLAFGFWLPSKSDLARVVHPWTKTKVSTRVPQELVVDILHLYVGSIDPVIRWELPLIGLLPTTWMLNTFLILNDVYDALNLGVKDYIKTELIPALFKLERSSTILHETVIRLSALGRENQELSRLSVASSVGQNLKQLVETDRQIADLETSFIKKITKQRAILKNLANTACFLKTVFTEANAKNLLEFSRDDFKVSYLQKGDYPETTYGCIDQLLNAAELFSMHVAKTCPLRLVGETTALGLETRFINLDVRDRFGFSHCFNLQVSPNCFFSSAALRTKSNMDRYLFGRATARALLTAPDVTSRAFDLDVMYRGRDGNPIFYDNDHLGSEREPNRTRIDLAHVNRAVADHIQTTNLLFGRANPFNEPQLRRRPPEIRWRPGQNLAQVFENNTARIQGVQAIEREEFLAEPVARQQANVNNAINYNQLLRSHLLRLRGTHEQYLIMYTDYCTAATPQTVDPVLRAQLNMVAMNTRNADLLEFVRSVSNQARVLDDAQLTRSFGLVCLPRTPQQYHERVVADLIGDIGLNFLQIQGGVPAAKRIFTCPISNTIDQLIGAEHCLLWKAYRDLENGSAIFINNGEFIDQPGDVEFTLHSFFPQELAQTVSRCLDMSIQAIAKHPTVILQDLAFILIAIRSFFKTGAIVRFRPFSDYVLLSALFCFWSATIFAFINAMPAAGVEFPVIWTLVSCYHEVISIFQIDGRGRLPPDVIPVNLRSCVLAEVYLISRAFLQLYPLIDNLREDVRNRRVAATNIDPPLAGDDPINVFLAGTLISNENRFAFRACIHKFA